MNIRKLLPLLLMLSLLLSLSTASIVTAQEPTAEPTEAATAEPTNQAAAQPAEEATATSTVAPTQEATAEPTENASAQPAEEATVAPTQEATAEPTEKTPTEEKVAPQESSVGTSAATSKALSTNFTLQNFGTNNASVTANYLLSSGTAWTGVPSSDLSFTIDANGGQKIFAQYNQTGLVAGKGSVVLSSDQQLGAIVQIQARGQTPTSGAYSGITAGSSKYYAPLAIRNGNSADGTVNTQIVVQNVGSAALDFSITFNPFSGGSSVTKNYTGLAAGSSQYVDLSEIADLPAGAYSAVVAATTTGGQVAAVINQFAGANGLQTYNAFSAESVGDTWLAPLVVNLDQADGGNGLNTPVTFQNLSGDTLNAGDIKLECVGDANTTATTKNFTLTNNASVANNGSYAFNPVVANTFGPGSTVPDFPKMWFGSCKISAPTGKNGVAFVQMRNIGTANQAAYEAINANGTKTTVQVPLVSKLLANNFATVLTIQNLSLTKAANIKISYKPAAGNAEINNGNPIEATVNAGGSFIHNHRLLSGPGSVPQMPAKWVGTATVTSDTPIGAFEQLTIVGGTVGDTLMAVNVFSQ